MRAVFALVRTRFAWPSEGVHTSVNAARTSARATLSEKSLLRLSLIL